MYIYWNEIWQEVLQKHFSSLFNWEDLVNFFILSWASWVWKKTLIKKLAKEYLWKYYDSDFFVIKDYTKYLWKKHSLKIGEDWKLKSIELLNKEKVVDYTVRWIIEWLSKTSPSAFKILLIENIDRLTAEAGNALLKTFEESTNKIILIWTTQNHKNLLNTILSRANIIKFEESWKENLKKYLDENFGNIDDSSKEILCKLSWNRIWISYHLLNDFSKWDFTFSDIKNNFDKFIKLSKYEWYYNEKISILKIFSKYNILEIIFDWLIHYYESLNNYIIVDKIIYCKKLLSANVWLENILFYFVLSLDKLNVKENK